MRRIAALVLVVAVAVMFAVPAFAGESSPCNTCAKPCPSPCAKPCVTCPSCPDSVFQSLAGWINSWCMPNVCAPCNTCAKPCPSPCAKPCPAPCSK